MICWQKSPDDSDIDLYPEGCDGKQSIILLFDIGEDEKVLTALHKKEYVKLVCKEATLKKEFPDQVKMKSWKACVIHVKLTVFQLTISHSFVIF